MLDRLTTASRRLTTAVRSWYDRRSDAFKAGWVTAWVTAAARASVPILTLVDDVGRWIEGTGPAIGRDQLVNAGRISAAAVYGVGAFVINYWFRRRRPNVTYTPAAPPRT